MEERNLNMKLVLDGLYEINNPNTSQVKFTANSYTRRVFSVIFKPGVTVQFHLCLIMHKS